MTKEEAGKLFDQVDRNGDGVITMEEWLGNPVVDRVVGISDVLSFFGPDTDRNEKISREEFLMYLGRTGRLD
ncbi:EF-hand domain-containing protein [Streptomyces xanthophaeus]